ncbi:DegT/DnrJ/EryC1/StrS family aminotransferase [Thiospirochaeta perfilievii]|uniref:DegT/DnrJ/EryC1/StrS family aminotransferase n=1 Tax=Thiospirochaeta perfilievii TaxID=252967 RepID=A0A5C1QEX5_9SPIO|nr:DegT/DnrJ/EryC1/StrS family aminotransferase [Thiospirochaeta perfilievii]QEN05630.1 DegT/DnrJ/EryC1/StrS family aminotransferase [Thiospirochaeta perfilievii]
MEFCDLKKQYDLYKTEIDKAIQGVIDTTSFIKGPALTEFEKNLAKYTGIKHAIGCASGTDALVLPLMAWGIGVGDEVIVPDFTFIATAEMVSFAGATPVFVDVDPITYNMSPKAFENAITDKTKAVIPVSIFGQMADLDEIIEIAHKHGIKVIEDGAQSFGAESKGRKSCSIADCSTTSFFPAKPLGCYGDGGAVFTNNDELANKMRIILNHGQVKRYHHSVVGFNGRLDTIQAAILDVKLSHFEDEIVLRNKVASEYTKRLKGIVGTPEVLVENNSVWAQYTIMVEKRDELADYLKQNDIPTSVHYPIPLSQQDVYRNEAKVSNPVTEKISARVLSLPMHPFLTTEEIDLVCNTIKAFYGK